jgi:hypothetical protein
LGLPTTRVAGTGDIGGYCTVSWAARFQGADVVCTECVGLAAVAGGCMSAALLCACICCAQCDRCAGGLMDGLFCVHAVVCAALSAHTHCVHLTVHQGTPTC